MEKVSYRPSIWALALASASVLASPALAQQGYAPAPAAPAPAASATAASPAAPVYDEATADAPQSSDQGNSGQGYGGAGLPSVGAEPELGNGAGTGNGLEAQGGAPRGKRQVVIRPYIEAGQVVDVPLSGAGAGPVTGYALAAAGVDVQLNGRNTQASASLRYEHDFNDIGPSGHGNTLSGIVRGQTALGTPALRLDYGAMAMDSYVSSAGASTTAVPTSYGERTHVYTGFIGPSLATHMDDIQLSAHYHIAYTKEHEDTTTSVGALTGSSFGFDHSTSQNAAVAVGNKPGDGLPVGLGAEAGFVQEDGSLLDQRSREYHGRAQIIIPLVRDVALVGGIGFENIEVSSRDALRNASGALIYSSGGQLQTEPNSARTIAYQTSGLMWDGGVIWQPSRRMHFEAHVGRRYGHIGYNGSLKYTPNDRTSLNIVVYDTLGGFGGGLTDAMVAMPTTFNGVRDAITGELLGCVASTTGGCIASATGAQNGLVFRAQGVMANWGAQAGRLSFGAGLGYDRHQYLTSAQTALASYNGKVDQYYWASAYISDRLSKHETLQGTLNLYHFQSGLDSLGDMNAIRASGLYKYDFTQHLSASAMLAIDGVSRPVVDDLWTASGALGMRYSF